MIPKEKFIRGGHRPGSRKAPIWWGGLKVGLVSPLGAKEWRIVVEFGRMPGMEMIERRSRRYERLPSDGADEESNEEVGENVIKFKVKTLDNERC